jgi:Transcriptional regulators of sugar metabolism
VKKAERIERLEERLKEAGVMHLSDAASHLGVSEMTVRRDLASAPNLFSYLGGYILPVGGERTTYRLDAEADTHAEAKELACRKAARLVEPDDTIFIDCGTTTPRMTEYLPVSGKLTVITYAMNVAERVMKRPDTNLILLGASSTPRPRPFQATRHSDRWSGWGSARPSCRRAACIPSMAPPAPTSMKCRSSRRCWPEPG